MQIAQAVKEQAKPRQEHPAYRADIDGLRAVAVLSVLFYHAFPNVVRGGFIGVDIFFVISGYLISSIIFANVERRSFSFVDFYIRRIRRIFPALILCLTATLAIGWFVLVASEYRVLGYHVIAAAAFSSNILLYQLSDYFDSSSNYKQLLHLWSLGVEEQFYLVWPVFVGLAWRRWNLLRLTVFIGAISFVACLYFTHANLPFAYYMPFTRFWELMLGGALAYLQLHHTARPLERFQNGQSILGLCLIAAALLFISADVPFPGWRALLPTFGAFFLISAGRGAIVNRLLLSNPLMVWVGLISYPLYLWHWPLLSYLYLLRGGPAPAAMRAGALLLAILLAMLTYLLIEKPLKRIRRGGLLASILLSLLVLLGIAGFLVFWKAGLPSRTVNKLNASDTVLAKAPSLIRHGCGMSKADESFATMCLADNREPATYALVGDSKAEALFPALVQASSPHQRWLAIGGHSAFQFIREIPHDAKHKYAESTQLAALLHNPSIRVVVILTALRSLLNISDRTDRYLDGAEKSPNYPQARQGLENYISPLVQANKKVILVIDNPPLADPPLCVSRRSTIPFFNALSSNPRSSRCQINLEQWQKITSNYRPMLDQVASKWKGSVFVYDPTPQVCDLAAGQCPSEMDRHMLYSYGDHLSAFAESRIAPPLIALVNQVASGNQP